MFGKGRMGAEDEVEYRNQAPAKGALWGLYFSICRSNIAHSISSHSTALGQSSQPVSGLNGRSTVDCQRRAKSSQPRISASTCTARMNSRINRSQSTCSPPHRPHLPSRRYLFLLTSNKRVQAMSYSNHHRLRLVFELCLLSLSVLPIEFSNALSDPQIHLSHPLRQAKPLPLAVPESTAFVDPTSISRHRKPSERHRQTVWPAPGGGPTPVPILIGEPCGGKDHLGPTECAPDPHYVVECVAVPEDERDFDISTCRRVLQTACPTPTPPPPPPEIITDNDEDEDEEDEIEEPEEEEEPGNWELLRAPHPTHPCRPFDSAFTSSNFLFPPLPSPTTGVQCYASCSCPAQPPGCPRVDCERTRCRQHGQLPWLGWAEPESEDAVELTEGWDSNPRTKAIPNHCPRCTCQDIVAPCPSQASSLSCPQGATTTYHPVPAGPLGYCAVLMCRRCRWWERCDGANLGEEADPAVTPPPTTTAPPWVEP
ncbi:hypothetical protein CC2G_004435 [Coprinopsis cinerea AmutBmut pab1-1]|nr:hypothetical protein CC2G_004435 [Coprinopsis cinerea AmutBmut pab1-1]